MGETELCCGLTIDFVANSSPVGEKLKPEAGRAARMSEPLAYLAENDPKREDIHRLIIALAFGERGKWTVRVSLLPAWYWVLDHTKPQPRTRTRAVPKVPREGTAWKSVFSTLVACLGAGNTHYSGCNCVT